MHKPIQIAAMMFELIGTFTPKDHADLLGSTCTCILRKTSIDNACNKNYCLVKK